MKRKLHYFKVDKADDAAAPLEKFESVLKEIVSLKPNQKGVVYGGDSGDIIRLTNFRSFSDHYRGSIAKYRADHLLTGSLNDDRLEELALANGGLIVELTRFVYFPRTSIIAIEYNYSGPRATTLVWYVNCLMQKVRSDPPSFDFLPVLHPDVLKRLESAKEIRLLELALPKERITGRATKQNDFIKALSAAATLGNTGQIGITLKGPRKRGDKTPLMSSRELVRMIRSGNLDLGMFGKANVRVVYEHQTEMINLLENKIQSEINIPGSIGLAREDEWFGAIVANYQVNRDLIIQASGNELSSG